MHFTIIQFVFLLISSATAGVTGMAVRDLLRRPDKGQASHAKPLASLSAATTLVFAVIFAVSL